MDEFDIIARLLRPLATGDEALELADDAAILACPLGRQIVVTSDMLQAEVHFFADDPPAAIAQKALRVNLSDLAAMGADPYCYFLCLGLPRDMTPFWLEQFVTGLSEDQERYDIRLAGGDTTVTRGSMSLSITALGTVPAGTALQRSGAKVGDDIYVSGTLGDAALGLTVRHSTHIVKPWRMPSVERYLLPQPRTELGAALRGIASAAMDSSDGMLQDLMHLCAASGVAADVSLPQLPLSEAVAGAMEDGFADWQLIVAGGDDYELIFTASPKMAKAVEGLSAQTDTRITKIGRIRKGDDVLLLDQDGKHFQVVETGYRHRLQKRQ